MSRVVINKIADRGPDIQPTLSAWLAPAGKLSGQSVIRSVMKSVIWTQFSQRHMRDRLSVPTIAVIYLYKPCGKLLLQHRTDDAPRYPGYWSPFGGAIEQGETPETAVRRETKEELDYDLKAPELFKAYPFSHETIEYLIYAFVEEYDGSPLTLGEGQGMGWFDEEGRRGLLMHELDRSVSAAVERAVLSRTLRIR